MTFTAAELDFLERNSLGRMATIGPSGEPHNHPVTYRVGRDTGAVDIGGPFMRASRKWRNLERDARISFVVDDLATEALNDAGQRGRGVEIRGDVEFLDAEPLIPGFTRDRIRIHPRRVISWNLSDGAFDARDVR